jgi:hypothetical protein
MKANPDGIPATDDHSSQNRPQWRFFESSIFWLLAWLGTVVSAGLFLAIASPSTPERPAILLIGSLLVGSFGIPIVSTIAIATWAFWLSRFRVYTASLAGGLTCVLSYVFSLREAHSDVGECWVYVLQIAFCGAVGCPLFAYWPHRFFLGEIKRQEYQTPWQFTLKDLLVRFTVLAVLISIWVSAVAAISHLARRL